MVANSFKYEEIEFQGEKKNILVLGLSGAGKSTLNNKFAHFLNDGEISNKMEQVFAAKRSLVSVT